MRRSWRGHGEAAPLRSDRPAESGSPRTVGRVHRQEGSRMRSLARRAAADGHSSVTRSHSCVMVWVAIPGILSSAEVRPLLVPPGETCPGSRNSSGGTGRTAWRAAATEAWCFVAVRKGHQSRFIFMGEHC